MNPFPVSGVVAESTDGPMTPPLFLQLERNQLGVSPESTDGKMTPTRGELMETAEINNGFVEAPRSTVNWTRWKNIYDNHRKF